VVRKDPSLLRQWEDNGVEVEGKKTNRRGKLGF